MTGSGVEKQLSRQPHKLETTGASPVTAPPSIVAAAHTPAALPPNPADGAGHAQNGVAGPTVAELLKALNAGRVTIPTPDFIEWVAARCMRFEGLDPEGCVDLDYAVRLRAMASALRSAIGG